MRLALALVLALTACGPISEGEEDAGTTTPDAGTTLPPIDHPADMPAVPSTVSRADSTCTNGRKVFVRRAVDGDTLELTDKVNGDYEHVRLVGVNTPETHPADAIECYGTEAANWTTRVIVNKLACLTYDPAVTRQSNNKDAYGRTLGYLFFGEDNQRFLNGELVYLGYARKFPFTNGAVYASYIQSLETSAKGGHRGLWDSCN